MSDHISSSMKQKIYQVAGNIRASKGEITSDLLLNNIQILDVFTNTLLKGSLLINNGYIVAVNPDWDFKVKEELDGNGMIAVPGFMDAHVHIETTLLTPEALADVIVPWGTTSLFVDAMEIANVAGLDGLETFLDTGNDLPYSMFIEVPSRVPTAPGLETTGGVIGAAEVAKLLKSEMAVSLGELDPSKVLTIKDEYLEKIITARDAGKICNGHAIGLGWKDLNTYASAGLSDCHESVTYEELVLRLRLGIKGLIREGSTERNVHALVSGIVEHDLPTNDLMFCTDDKHVNDIKNEGHISYNIQKSIDLGLNPIIAIKMATIQIAQHFRVDHLVGSLTPGKYADIVLLPDLKTIKPQKVFKQGKLVAENGVAIPTKMRSYPEHLLHTVILSDSFRVEDFNVLTSNDSEHVRVINIYPEQIINYQTIEHMEAQNGRIVCDIERDILKISVVERYGKNGQVGIGFIHGFGLKKGAIASSVSHDHHNIVIVGTNDRDMYLAVKELERCQGGFCAVVDEQLLGILPLPLGGLMSLSSASEVLEETERINAIVKKMGCSLPAPFMSLSFISLPTVPELGLTDMGLINVREHALAKLFIDNE